MDINTQQDECSVSTNYVIRLSSFKRHKIYCLYRAPYSPHMDPCDFWPLPKLKILLKLKRFEEIEERKRRPTRKLMIHLKINWKNASNIGNITRKASHFKRAYLKGTSH